MNDVQADSLLESLLSGDGLIVLIAGGVFIAVLAALFFITPNDELGRRIRSVVQPPVRSGALASGRKQAKPSGSVNMMRDVTSKLNLLSGKQASKMVEKLTQAGWRSKDALVMFAFARLCTPILMGGVGAFLFVVLDALKKPLTFDLAGIMVFMIIGVFLPNVIVKNAIDRRKGKLRKALPDALDLLVICSEAGLSLDAGVSRVSREFANSSRELAEELNITSFELSFMPERRMAFDGLRKRINLPAVQSLCSTLEQTEKFGTPLAQALRVLSQEQRNDRMMRAEEKAARLPALMTVPLILFILPALFVVVMGPAILSIIDAFSKMQ